MSDSLEDWLGRVYEAGGDVEKLNQAYDAWALEYDQQLWASGNPYILYMTGLAARHIPDTGARILDAGCGTGMMATPLQMIGYSNIVGLDASPGMLEIARRKGCYTELHELLLGEKIDLPDDSFDAILAAGVLAHGHAPAESLDGLLRLARPGAPILFSLSVPAYETAGFKEKMTALTDDRRLDADGRDAALPQLSLLGRLCRPAPLGQRLSEGGVDRGPQHSI